jgi:purine-cytosine permease-like protein
MEEPTVLSVIVNWLPMFLYVVLMWFAAVVARYVSYRKSFDKHALEQMQRQAQALERIAAQLDKPRE